MGEQEVIDHLVNGPLSRPGPLGGAIRRHGGQQGLHGLEARRHPRPHLGQRQSVTLVAQVLPQPDLLLTLRHRLPPRRRR